MFKKQNKAITLFAICLVLINGINFAFHIFLSNIHAAGVAVTITNPSTAEFNALTATDVTFKYVASTTQFASGNTITVTVAPTLAGALTNCTSATTDVDGDATPDGALGSFTTSGAVYTFTASTTAAMTTGASICLKFASSTVAGTYSISITDTNDNDYGAALVYAGDDNDVNVTALVSPVLSFAIRNSADTTGLHACPLGTLTLAAVSTCAYRLKVTTNSTSGYTIQINSDGDLRKSGSGDVADALDIDKISEATVTAGTEGYGIAVIGGSITGGTLTEAGIYASDDSAIPGTATNLITTNGPNSPSSTDTTNTTLITHKAAIDGGTTTGNYTQVVNYYVSASF